VRVKSASLGLGSLANDCFPLADVTGADCALRESRDRGFTRKSGPSECCL
jgi:hypothetical protein